VELEETGLCWLLSAALIDPATKAVLTATGYGSRYEDMSFASFGARVSAHGVLSGGGIEWMGIRGLTRLVEMIP
jgi:hypothetical protein